MLIQTTQEILDYEGNPIPQGDKNLTVRDVVFLALNNWAENEPMPTSQQKLDAFRITAALFADVTAEVSIEDAAYIKERSGAISGALTHGRLCEILERAGQLPAVESNGVGKVKELVE